MAHERFFSIGDLRKETNLLRSKLGEIKEYDKTCIILCRIRHLVTPFLVN